MYELPSFHEVSTEPIKVPFCCAALDHQRALDALKEKKIKGAKTYYQELINSITAGEVNTEDWHKWTPTMFAALAHDGLAFEKIIRLRGDLLKYNNDGMNTVGLAAKWGASTALLEYCLSQCCAQRRQEAAHLTPYDEEIVDCPLDGGCGDCERLARFLSYRDATGRTALHYAAECGQFREVFWLCAFGADVNARDTNRLTPLDYADRVRCPETIARLQHFINRQAEDQ